MINFNIHKSDLIKSCKITIIEAVKTGSEKEDVEAALDAKVAECVGYKGCNKFKCEDNPYLRIVLEGASDLFE